jgi:hypothetical protein
VSVPFRSFGPKAMGWCLVLGLCMSMLCGCAQTSVSEIAQALDERQIQSCIFITGAYSMFVGISITTATGGATIESCRLLR